MIILLAAALGLALPLVPVAGPPAQFLVEPWRVFCAGRQPNIVIPELGR